MKTIGKLVDHFPETPDECQTWKPITVRSALAMEVLAVAHTRIEGAWCAYIDAVPGQDHAIETKPVLSHGNKLGETVALVLFPMFDGVPYAL